MKSISPVETQNAQILTPDVEPSVHAYCEFKRGKGNGKDLCGAIGDIIAEKTET
jgi:hypothetical protein